MSEVMDFSEMGAKMRREKILRISLHQHELTLGKVKSEEDNQIECKACGEKVSSLAYSCKMEKCSFFMHPFCANLPEMINHPLHSQHPLILQPDLLYLYGSCNACKNDKGFWRYECSDCEFKLDIICATSALNVKHGSHEHHLAPLPFLAQFPCVACGTKEEGFSYKCRTCRFWIHEECALLSKTIKHASHNHPLRLIHDPEIFKDYSYFSLCCVCKGTVEYLWRYRCSANCNFQIHVGCSTKIVERKLTLAYRIQHFDEANLVHLPLPNDSIDLIFNFLTWGLIQIDKIDDDQLRHFSHEHPLTLFKSHAQWLDTKMPAVTKRRNDYYKKCAACSRPISTSTSFYSCNQCNHEVSLHKWCAKVPKRLNHPFHRYSLELSTEKKYFSCNACGGNNHTFNYQSARRESSFRLHITCSFLPTLIKHEFHEHPLFLTRGDSNVGCVACDRTWDMFLFSCVSCTFDLHVRCALLPAIINHRYDKHPFKLTYSPIEGIEEYYCELCESKIKPEFWFYHCVDCDQSICARCLGRDWLMMGETND